MKNPASFLKDKARKHFEQDPTPSRDWKAMLGIASGIALLGALWCGYFFYAVVNGGFFSAPETASQGELSLDAAKLSDIVSFYEARAHRPTKLTGDEGFLIDPSR